MNRHRTLKRYRNIDLGLFALMLIVAEYLIIRAATRWFPAQPYTVSVAAAINLYKCRELAEHEKTMAAKAA